MDCAPPPSLVTLASPSSYLSPHLLFGNICTPSPLSQACHRALPRQVDCSRRLYGAKRDFLRGGGTGDKGGGGGGSTCGRPIRVLGHPRHRPGAAVQLYAPTIAHLFPSDVHFLDRTPCPLPICTSCIPSPILKLPPLPPSQMYIIFRATLLPPFTHGAGTESLETRLFEPQVR